MGKKARDRRFGEYLASQNGPVIETKNGNVIVEFKEKTLAQHEYRSIYLRSDHWKKKRLEKLKSVHFCCEQCHVPRFPLDVHHKTYIRKGEEELNDLLALCRQCHELEHKRPH